MGEVEEVRTTLARFAAGYAARDHDTLDEFMSLFSPADDIELIGVGASKRDGPEWFTGAAAIREIVTGDWTYWGSVDIDVDGAKITVSGDAAWLSVTGTLTSGAEYELAFPHYLEQMRDLVMDETRSLDDRLTDATHFGVNRLRDRMRGPGARWPFVITAVLIRSQDAWGFHTMHWSFPAE